MLPPSNGEGGLPRGRGKWGEGWADPPQTELEKQAVRILLECILVPALFQTDGQHYDVFIVYDHDHDETFLLNDVLSLLDHYDVTYVTEDCCIPGRDRFTCLQNIMTQSRAALVVISRYFLNENWELYQLNQAVCTEIEQKNFKV